MPAPSLNCRPWLRYALLAAIVPLTPAPSLAQDSIDGWTPVKIERLRHWIAKAPEDALPLLDTASLSSAEANNDQPYLNSAATDLALRLARMHLLGCATPAERRGWHIDDSDSNIDLRERLERAVSLDSIDAFFAGLQPSHPDYAFLRSAYAEETDPGRRQTIARNMERWRWMPQWTGSDFVLVNVPAFTAELWRNERQVGEWRVIVGKPSTPTPVFSATITGVILNPWWVVPASIQREMRGRFPASRGYVRSGGQVRQRPGPNNALGQMKLDMPNPYAVYMHDTPSKQLFDRDVRTFSHGCIRVADALGMTARLLEGVKTREEVDTIAATKRTTRIALAASLPVYITYFTAAAGDDGEPAFYSDIYGRDERVGNRSDGERSCGG